MTTIENKKEIQNWWAENPMTYSADTHGTTKYKNAKMEVDVKTGSKEFFENADTVFVNWNKPLHKNKPFAKIFPYEKYKNKKVLEIGCGMGFMSMLWALNSSRITAVDLNATAVEQTKKRFKLFNLAGNIKQADANKLPFGNASFDYVYSWGVLHHSPNLELSLAEMFRVLKPEGDFGLMLYNRHSLLHWYDTLYLEGFLHNELAFLNHLQLASRYGDGREQEGNPHTWPVTVPELQRILNKYSPNVQFKLLGTDIDGVLDHMLPGISFVIPKIVKKAWARRFGWSIWAYGKKS